MLNGGWLEESSPPLFMHGTTDCQTQPIINFPIEVKNVFANRGSISYDRKRMLIGRYL